MRPPAPFPPNGSGQPAVEPPPAPAGEKLRVLDLFAGIGGFSLGLERTGGFETVAFCEIEDFPRRVLRKHWPEVPIYEDVRNLTGERLAADGIAVDVITGGFPCQDISVVGRKAGISDGTRSGLWSEIVRLICEIRPRYVIVENVANLLSGPSEKRGGWFGRILGDLAECGYDAEWRNIPAAAVGLDQARERVWVIAHPHEIGRDRAGKYSLAEHGLPIRQSGVAKAPIQGRHSLERRLHALVDGCDGGTAAGRCGGGAHGIPQRLDRIAALGNAVVPQIPELIGRAILRAESQ